jgi:HK97 family phage prohead protease
MHKNKSKYEIRTLPAKELRIAPIAADGTRTLTGRAIMFNVRSLDLGGFQEIVAPAAVKQTLSSGNNLLLLNNHDTSQVLGSTRSKTMQVMTDSQGVGFSCQIDTRQTYAADLAIAVERQDIQGCSFGFRTNKDSWKNENGVLIRTLEAIEVLELSLTAQPAYTQTSTSVRSCPHGLRKLLTRSMDDDEDDDECECDCPECEDGDCADCSDPDCDDPSCDHGENSARSIDLWKLNMQLAIAQRR